MFYKYLVTNENNKQVLFLYVDNSFEFSSDNYKNNNDNIYTKIDRYIKNNKINFNGNKVMIVKNGIILGYIDLSDYDFFHNTYVELIDEDNKFKHPTKSLEIVDKIKIEAYIYDVISTEMPAIYNNEALKALAVIARTYAMKRISRNLPINRKITNKNDLKNIWGNNYEKYNKKILNAIHDTNNEVIMYEDDYIDAYYHLSSNGITEDSNNLLKISYPYLTSVSSYDNNKSISYRIFPNEYLSKLLNVDINKDTIVQTLIRTIGHRVKYIKFNDKVFDGLILSRRLGLNSNDFKVEINGKYTMFYTYGYGHGLGLSKLGAEEMAEKGYNYKQILNHYYPNTEIKKENS